MYGQLETVAMTGFQVSAAAGVTAMGEQTEPILPEKVAAALSIDNVGAVDAFDETAIAGALQSAFNKKGVSFMVVRGRCPYIETRHCRVTAGTAD